MKIGEVAKAAAVSKDAIRYYIETGLLHATKDPGNGYQLFSPTAVSRVRFIKQAPTRRHRPDFRRCGRCSVTLPPGFATLLWSGYGRPGSKSPS
jgi:hypothetical protein